MVYKSDEGNSWWGGAGQMMLEFSSFPPAVSTNRDFETLWFLFHLRNARDDGYPGCAFPEPIPAATDRKQCSIDKAIWM